MWLDIGKLTRMSTQSKVHFFIPANSHTHAVPMQCLCQTKLADLLFQRPFCQPCMWIHNWDSGANRRHQLGGMALEFSPLPVRCLFCLAVLCRPSVDTSWCHSYSKQSIQVCFTTSLPHPTTPRPTTCLPPTYLPLAMLSIKFMPTWKNHLKFGRFYSGHNYCCIHNEKH